MAVFVIFQHGEFRVWTVHMVQCERVFMLTMMIIIDPQGTFWISFRIVSHWDHGLNPPNKYSTGIDSRIVLLVEEAGGVVTDCSSDEVSGLCCRVWKATQLCTVLLSSVKLLLSGCYCR